MLINGGCGLVDNTSRVQQGFCSVPQSDKIFCGMSKLLLEFEMILSHCGSYKFDLLLGCALPTPTTMSTPLNMLSTFALTSETVYSTSNYSTSLQLSSMLTQSSSINTSGLFSYVESTAASQTSIYTGSC